MRNLPPLKRALDHWVKAATGLCTIYQSAVSIAMLRYLAWSTTNADVQETAVATKDLPKSRLKHGQLSAWLYR